MQTAALRTYTDIHSQFSIFHHTTLCKNYILHVSKGLLNWETKSLVTCICKTLTAAKNSLLLYLDTFKIFYCILLELVLYPSPLPEEKKKTKPTEFLLQIWFSLKLESEPK